MSYLIKVNNVLRTILALVLYKVFARLLSYIAMFIGAIAMVVAVLGVWMHPTPLDLAPAGLVDDEDIE